MYAASLQRSRTSAALWMLVAVACLLRLVVLDADPKFEFWIGYLTDESRWVETARNFALFGEPRLYRLSKLHLVLSPAHQAAVFAVFKLLDVGILPARLWTAACGVVLVITVARAFGRHAPGMPQFLAVAIVGFEPLTLSLSRTALPEIPSLLFLVGAFLAVATARQRVAGALFGGILFAVAASMKLTAVLVSPAFLLMIAWPGVAGRPGERILRLGAFALGAGIPAVVALGAAFAAGLVRVDAFSDISRPILQALEFGTPFVVISRYFLPPQEYASLVLLLAGVWAGSWVLPFRREFAGTPLGEMYRLSGIWVATWLVVVGSFGYTPSRYSVHCIVPLALHVASALALWCRIGPGRVMARAASIHPRWRLAARVWLCLPAAMIVLAAAFPVVVAAGGPLDRLSVRLAGIAFLLGAFVVVSGRITWTEPVFRAILAFSIGAAMLLTVWDAAAALAPREVSSSSAMLAARLVALAFLAVAIRKWSAVPFGGSARSLGMAWTCAAALAGFALQDLPAVLLPSYTIRDSSRDLGIRLAGEPRTSTYAAGSLLLETRLAFADEGLRGGPFGALVNAVRDLQVPPVLVPVATYFIVVHPRFARETRLSVESGRIRVDVYRNTHPDEVPALPPHGHPNRSAGEKQGL